MIAEREEFLCTLVQLAWFSTPTRMTSRLHISRFLIFNGGGDVSFDDYDHQCDRFEVKVVKIFMDKARCSHLFFPKALQNLSRRSQEQ